jgi:hypothetical protein
MSPPIIKISPRGKTRSPSPAGADGPSSFGKRYSRASMRPTARLTSRSSPVSAAKSIQSGRPRHSTTLLSLRDPRGAPSSVATARSSADGGSGRIQSRESTLSAAMKRDTKPRMWPKSDVTPYQRMPNGGCAPCLKASGTIPSPRPSSLVGGVAGRGAGGRLGTPLSGGPSRGRPSSSGEFGASRGTREVYRAARTPAAFFARFPGGPYGNRRTPFAPIGLPSSGPRAFARLHDPCAKGNSRSSSPVSP